MDLDDVEVVATQIFLGSFTPKIGEENHPIFTHIFQMGWLNHQLVDDVDVPGNQDLQVGLPYMVSLQTCEKSPI